jgi:aryl-alcohol dehydrogenase-like predicted oxidoreductase
MLGSLARHLVPPPKAQQQLLQPSTAAATPVAAPAPSQLVTVTPADGQIPTRRVQRLGVDLPVVGFGAFGLTADRTQDECNLAVARAVAAGATYFDVAPAYGNGTAERLLGPALAPHRQQVFLACKTGEREGGAATTELERSLAALQTDYFDLYQCHAVTTAQDVDRILAPGGALEAFKVARAVRQGCWCLSLLLE